MSMHTLARCASLLESPAFLDQPVQVGGWVLSVRGGPKLLFLALTDGSATAPLQVVMREASVEVAKLTTGAAVRVEGVLRASPGRGQTVEVHASHIEVVGRVHDPEHYPIQPKPLTDAFLRTVPHWRARTQRMGAVARVRHTLMESLRGYLDAQGFVWVPTPILTDSDAEGAGARFSVGTEDGEAFFGDEVFLTVSGQMEAEALCMALGRVYTFGPTFRAERSHTRRHLAEFWMLEPEMAWATLDDLIGVTEGLIQHAIRESWAKRPSEMALLSAVPEATWLHWAEHPFARMTYTEAVTACQGSGDDAIDRVVWGDDLSSVHEAWLVEQVGGPLVVTHYPQGIKAFYMKPSGDGKTVLAMDVLLPEWGEVAGGSVREEDSEALEARMRACEMDPALYPAYLDLRRAGSVPHAGFGLGFERLLAWLAGLESVKDASLYPRVSGKLAG
jgi:asparaginyl-tRNA synthetase